MHCFSSTASAWSGRAGLGFYLSSCRGISRIPKSQNLRDIFFRGTAGPDIGGTDTLIWPPPSASRRRMNQPFPRTTAAARVPQTFGIDYASFAAANTGEFDRLVQTQGGTVSGRRLMAQMKSNSGLRLFRGCQSPWRNWGALRIRANPKNATATLFHSG